MVLDRFAVNNLPRIPILLEAANYAQINQIQKGKALLRKYLPFIPTTKNAYGKINVNYDGTPYIASGRLSSPSLSQKIKRGIYLRDNYNCRYSGLRMFNPGLLSLLAFIYSEELPYQFPNGRFSETHQNMWDLGASPDHILPVTHHMDDTYNNQENLICCSNALNLLYKNRHPLEVLGWRILSRESIDKNWDGGEAIFELIINNNPEFFHGEPKIENLHKLRSFALSWYHLM